MEVIQQRFRLPNSSAFCRVLSRVARNKWSFHFSHSTISQRDEGTSELSSSSLVQPRTHTSGGVISTVALLWLCKHTAWEEEKGEKKGRLS